MNLITRSFSLLFIGLFGLVLSPISRAEDAVFSSSPAVPPHLYAFHSSYPNGQARSYPGERGPGYTYPGARAPGYTYPGAKGHGDAQQPHQEFNNYDHGGYKHGSGHQKPARPSHHTSDN